MDTCSGWRGELAILFLSVTGAYLVTGYGVSLFFGPDTSPVIVYGSFVVAFLLLYALLSGICRRWKGG